MAAAAEVTTNITITGLGSETQLQNTFTANAVPTEVTKLYTLISATSQALDWGGCAASTASGLLIKAVAQKAWVEVNSTDCTSTTAGIYIPEGESAYIPLNNLLVSTTSVWVLGTAAAAAIEYVVMAT